MDTPYQATFSMLSPAVFFAGGHGLCTTDLDEIPGLSDFIHRKSPTFDLSTLPDDFPKRPLMNPLAVDHLYFYYIVGWLWRIFGVSEQVLFYLTLAMRLVCALSVYALFRLGLSRFTALLAVLIIFTGPAFLDLDVSPRDLGKVPFILTAITLSAWLSFRSHSPRRMLMLSLLLGTGLGIGYGVRPDTVIALPIAVVTTAFFSKIRSPRAPLWRMAATALLLISFSILTYPITRASALEGNHRLSVHVICVGMLKSIENNLLPPHQPYTLIPDSFTGDAPSFTLVNVLAQRLGNRDSMINTSSAEYDYFAGERNTYPFVDPYLFYNGITYSKIGRVLLFQLATHFPADFLLRAWRATAVLFDLNHEHMQFMPDGATLSAGWLKGLITVQEHFTGHISRWGPLYFLAAFLGLAAISFRSAFIAALFFLWFSGYPSLQYEYRHAFYLVFIPVMAFAFFLEYLFRLLYRFIKDRKHFCSRKEAKEYVIRLCATAVCLLALYFLPMAGTRIYQHMRLRGLAESMAASPKTPVSVSLTQEEGRVLVLPDQTLDGLDSHDSLLSGEVGWAYASLVFDSFGKDIPLTIHYDRRRLFNDFTHELVLDGCNTNPNGRIEFFFPIYETDTTYSMDMLPQLLRTYPALADQVDDGVTPLAEQYWWRRGKFEGISFPEAFLPSFRGFNLVSPDNSIALLPFLSVPVAQECFQSHKHGPWELAFKNWKKDLTSLPTQESGAVWELTEAHLPSPAFEGYPVPLVAAESQEALIDQWEDILRSCPDLQEVACRDLLNDADRQRELGKNWHTLRACKQADLWTVSNPLPAMRLGELYEANGDTVHARDAYRRALLLHPYLPQTADRLDALLSEAETLEVWKELFEAHGDDLFTGMRLALYYEDASLYEKALDVFMQVHHTHPDNPDTRLSLARCLARTDKAAESLHFLQSVLTYQPDYTLLVTQHAASLAELFSSKEDYGAVISFLEYHAIVSALDLEQLVSLATAYRQIGLMDRAQKALEQALILAEGEGAEQVLRIEELLVLLKESLTSD